MKKTFKAIIVAAVVTVMLFSLSIPCFAEAKVTYTGNSGNFIFEPGTKENPTDLFIDFKDLMPGDTVTEEIEIVNKADDQVNVEVFLKSVGADENSAEFLKNLKLTVKAVDGDVLSSDKADAAAGLNDYVSLGKIASGASTKLQVTLEVPKELTNDYQESIGNISWQFMVEEKPVEKPAPTADNSMLWLFVAVFVLGLAAGSALVVLRRKNRV